MRRRSLTDMARISELLWEQRLSRWVERYQDDRARLEMARSALPPTQALAVAAWARFSAERDETIKALTQAAAESARGVTATTHRLNRARARTRAARRAAERKLGSSPQDSADLEAWLIRKRAAWAKRDREDAS
ncbi:MAG: hypothetical protein H5T86_02895 [Armatimonadetes bacterium]|nr:hypothetical protein [Armatimonadota bacterium]